MSQSVVRSIYQDRQGFLWFGTWDGLNCYDGHEFKVYRHSADSPGTISDSRVEVIYQADDGMFWIATHAGLDRFDPVAETFQQWDLGQDASEIGSINDILGAAGGRIWVSTAQGGLFQIDPSGGTPRRFVHDPNDEHSLSHNTVSRMGHDPSGALWLGTRGGLDRFDPDSGQFRHYELDATASDEAGLTVSVFVEGEYVVWAGTSRGAFRLDARSGEIRSFRHDPTDPRSLPDTYVTDFLRAQDGSLWVGTFGGGACVQGRGETGFMCFMPDPSTPFSLSHDCVTDLWEDASGVVWIATHGGGLTKIVPDPSPFEIVRLPGGDNVSRLRVTGAAEDSLGTLWVATDKGLFQIDSNGAGRRYRNRPQDPSSLPNDYILSLLLGESGHLWVGTLSGLGRMDVRAGTFEYFPFEGRPMEISALFRDASGGLWVGTIGHGLLHLPSERGKLVRYEMADIGPVDTINVICGDAVDSHVLWLGTETQGLLRLDRSSGRIQAYRHKPGDLNSLSHDTVSALRFDRDGDLWVGTYGGGLNRLDLDSGHATRFDLQDGLPNPIIYGIQEDHKHRLWASTNKGIVSFDPRHPIFAGLDVRDGLPTNEFNIGAYAKASDGTLYFGSVAGLLAIHPNRMMQDRYLPPVVFTSLRNNNQSIRPSELGEVLSLPYGSGLLSIEFTALDFRQPDKIRYAYRFKGHSNGWIDLGDSRELSFPNLSPGSYSLEVRGSNTSGVWSDRTAVLEIQVLAPWWMWWWVRLAGVLAVGGLVWSARWFWRRHSRRHQMALQAEVERRKQLHEALLRRIASADGQGVEATQAAPWWLRQARDRLRKEFRQAPTVKELADAAGTHPDYLGRCFRDHYGIRITEYVDRLRLEWAAEQLVGTDDKIVDIALDAGFVDQSHLTRRFKKRFGVTPAQYRRFSQRGAGAFERRQTSAGGSG